MLASWSARRQVFWLGLAIVLTFAAGVTAAAVVQPAASSRNVPVILVHGLGGTPSQMSTIARRLQRDGRRTVLVALPSRGLVPIAQSAAAIDAAVRRTGADDVDFVGYSLGGVVVRYWVARLDKDERARRVVTLASPHHGARLADDAAILDPQLCRGACAEVRPRSRFLQLLNAEDETPGDADWFTVHTARDRTVQPVESATLDGAVNIRMQDICSDSRVGHGSINRDSLSVGLVVIALSGQLRYELGQNDCVPIRALGQ